MYKQKKKGIAEERVEYLFNLIASTTDKELQKNAANMISKVRTRHNVRLTKEQKQVFCKFCGNIYTNSKSRFRKIKKNGQLKLQKIVICGACGKESRFDLGKV